MPQTEPSACTGLNRREDGLHFEAPQLSYRVSGLVPYSLDRLRITLKAWKRDNGGHFHIDTLDLYNANARQTFTDACKISFKLADQDTGPELMMLIAHLEQERIRMKDEQLRPTVQPMTDQEKKEALAALQDKNLMRRIVEDFDRLGIVGEENNKLIGYIGAVSRLLPDPLGVLILSRSGAGKTSIQDAVCKFIPEEALIQYTRLTGQSLFYREPNALKHKVLAIEEEDGMNEAIYSIRTLLSSQKLSIATTRADAKTGKFGVDEYTVYGPTVVMLSTTNPDTLDGETKQRFLILTIDESMEQTKRIMQMQRLRHTLGWKKMNMDEADILRLHHNMQRLLKPLDVRIPEAVKVKFPAYCLQSRRENSKFYSFLRAIALLHQYQRKQTKIKDQSGKTYDAILAEQRDADLALELGRDVFIRNLDDVTPPGRSLLLEITKLIDEKFQKVRADHPDVEIKPGDIHFTRKELRQRIGWSESQVRQNIEPLVELGYLGLLGGKHGATFRYILLDDGQNDPKLVL